MFNTNNRFSSQREASRPEGREVKGEIKAVYNGKGTEISFECACSGVDLLNMYASITSAFLNAGIEPTDLVSAIAAAYARKITDEE